MAMAVSFGIKSWIEGGVVTAIIFLNIVVGFWQEYAAEKTMDSLRSLSSPTASAIRDGKTVTVPTIEVVPGDMIELKTGDTIPADVRLVATPPNHRNLTNIGCSLIEAVNFETDEALLTGESLPVSKNAEAVFDEDTGPGDRLNVAYSSSTVTKGRARGVVFATGMHTEIGTIAASLRQKGSRRREVKRKVDGTAKPHRYAQAWGLTATDAIGHFLGVNVGTPLQKKLSRLALLLFGVAVICAIIVLAANGFSNNQEVIIYAVATGLSMIPASLIVVLTITMSAGTKRMVERNVIVRSLKSLEALGAVTGMHITLDLFPAHLTITQISALIKLERSRKVRWWRRKPGFRQKERTLLVQRTNLIILPLVTSASQLRRRARWTLIEPTKQPRTMNF
jgi:Na+-exporting ATPase